MSVTLHTNHGDIKLELFCELTPKTCNNFLALYAKKFYDNTIIDRNIPGLLFKEEILQVIQILDLIFKVQSNVGNVFMENILRMKLFQKQNMIEEEQFHWQMQERIQINHNFSLLIQNRITQMVFTLHLLKSDGKGNFRQQLQIIE